MTVTGAIATTPDMVRCGMPRYNKFTAVKPCNSCGQFFAKSNKYSWAQWELREHCSRTCGSWNKGLKRDDDPRMQSIARHTSERCKGQVAWNRGLTADQDERVARQVANGSGQKKGHTPSAAQLSGLDLGRHWCAGLTAKDDPRLSTRAQKTAAALKGRKNPEQSQRQRDYYAKHPERHPNALLAKKTRGHGYTYIERLTAEYLKELGLSFRFNMRVGRKWVDFALEGSGLVVEADGEYWHTDMQAEKERDAHIEAHGWRVLHLTGSQIVKDAQGCKYKILRAAFYSIEASG